MQPSARILAFIKGFEKLRLVGYLPTPEDRPTIGWGHTGPDIRVGEVWTKEQADAEFAADIAHVAGRVSHLVYRVPTTQGQFDALVSLAYNIGAAALGGSSLLRFHKQGRYGDAAAEFLKWDHQAGRVLPGLLRRRQAEALIYQS